MYIAVFAPQNSVNTIQSVINENNLAKHFKCIKYNNLQEIYDMYMENKSDISGILFTGNFTKKYFTSKVFNCNIPICHIEHTPEMCYIYLIKILEEEKTMSLNDIFCDFIVQDNQLSLLKDIIPQNSMPVTTKIDTLSPNIFDLLCDEITELYESKKIKKALVTLTNVYERLLHKNIPCELISIRKYDIEKSLKNIYQLVSDKKLNGSKNVTAFIDYALKDDITNDFATIEYKEATLMKILVDYKKSLNKNEELNIVRATGMIELSYIYNNNNVYNYSSFLPLFEYILANFQDDFAIGIGIEKNISLSRKNAFFALDLSKDFGNRYAFVVEDTTVTGPIDEDNCISFDISLTNKCDEMSKLLNTTKMNYIRVYSLFNEKNYNVTSDMIASCLNMTVRSANRILKAMLENNIIMEMPMSRDINLKKGRPVKYYKLVDSMDFLDK